MDENLDCDKVIVEKYKSRNKLIIIGLLLLVFSIWFFSHSLTPEKALFKEMKKANLQFEVIDSLSVEKGEVFFVLFSNAVSQPDNMAAIGVERNGLFYNPQYFGFSSVDETHSKENQQYDFVGGVRTIGGVDYDTIMACSWGQVESMEADGILMDKAIFQEYTIFYGAYPTDKVSFVAYDENKQVLPAFI